ncbi:MAG TPA: hypothetical protein VK995_02100, partial [Oceanipulchritudo sp.]|nr:hypothetical protein [Oceanipulchritudo sp.]
HKDSSGGRRNKSLVHADLDIVQARIDAKPDPTIPGSRIIIGEYGYIYDSRYSSLEEFADNHRLTARNFVSWQGGTLRFVLQWQFFNSATLENNPSVSRHMCQIGPANDLRPLYYMHENFNRLMRRWVDDFHMRTGSLPDARAYADQAAYVLEFVLGGSLSEYNPVLSFNSYASWQDYHFLDASESASAAISGPDADPYATGIANLLRYGLGMGKFGYESSRLPHIRHNGGAFAYAVPFDPAKTDLRWLIEADSTLSQWNFNLFDSSIEVPVMADGWMEVSADGLIDPGVPVFYRLQLHLIP